MSGNKWGQDFHLAMLAKIIAFATLHPDLILPPAPVLSVALWWLAQDFKPADKRQGVCLDFCGIDYAENHENDHKQVAEGQNVKPDEASRNTKLVILLSKSCKVALLIIGS